VITPQLRQWVVRWREADVARARVKRAELERLETAAALRQLSDAFRDAAHVPRVTPTGLVEQQRIFQRLRG
jgi:hypothetical protein